METRKGIAVSPGVALGRVVLMGQEDLQVHQRSISRLQVDAEIKRLDQAVCQAVEQIQGEIDRFGDELSIPRQILESHRDIIADRTLHDEIVQRIREGLSTAEHALSLVLNSYYSKFEKMESEYIAERAHDLSDIEKKLLRILLGRKASRKPPGSSSMVIVAHDLTPGEAASMDRKHVLAFVVDIGGRTSHTAIMARALQIPAVVGLENLSASLSGGEQIIVDGYKGIVIIGPDRETLDEYRLRSRHSKKFYATLRCEVRLPAETLDGYEIKIAANIEFPEEIHTALEWGASGVGLYRTEFLYDAEEPDEEKHYKAYRRALKQLGGRFLVLRTLDAGADKFHDLAVGRPEPNPFLGCRAIRLCFQRPHLFRVQLRAILRASALGRTRIMFPMISNLSELRQAKAVLREVQEELSREGVAFDRNMPIGVMVEVPAAALLADLLAREVDFFSIGTNDLIQYSLAVDRVNERVAHLYQPADPAMLRLISSVAEAGRRQGIDVSICGEMSSEPMYTILLLGLGLRSLSLSPISIPLVKRLIRKVKMREAEEVAKACLEHETAEESQALLERWTRRYLPEIC